MNGHVRVRPTRREQRIYRTNVLAGDRACVRLPPPNFHGKEGVDGSSPSEGFHAGPAKSHVLLPRVTCGKQAWRISRAVSPPLPTRAPFPPRRRASLPTTDLVTGRRRSDG